MSDETAPDRHEVEAGETLILRAKEDGAFLVTFESAPDPDLLPQVGDVFPCAEPDWAADHGGPYEFDKFGVWYRDGVWFWGTDQGCSCPTPWEGLTRYSQLTAATAKQVLTAYLAWIAESNFRSTDVQEIGELSSFLGGGPT